MCTAISFKTGDHYFGRNLDLEKSYGEVVAITPRKYPLQFKKEKTMNQHLAMIGMAAVVDGYPLYFEAVNEKGVGMAGLNFPGNAVYGQVSEDSERDQIAAFEFIPWILSQSESVEQARRLCERINIVNLDFSQRLPATPLHWIISDESESITVEAVREGVKVYDNPVGVLTNNPTFDVQMFNLNNYRHLSRTTPKNSFTKHVPLEIYSRGMGALGLPGDLSSASRFVKAIFTKENSLCGNGEAESISQFFHILESVYQQRGCVMVAPDQFEITIYSSCINASKGIYYYKTYENSQITGVDMYREDLDGSKVITYPLEVEQNVNMIN